MKPCWKSSRASSFGMINKWFCRQYQTNSHHNVIPHIFTLIPLWKLKVSNKNMHDIKGGYICCLSLYKFLAGKSYSFIKYVAIAM